MLGLASTRCGGLTTTKDGVPRQADCAKSSLFTAARQQCFERKARQFLAGTMQLKWGARPSRSHPSASCRLVPGKPTVDPTVSRFRARKFSAGRRKQRARRHALPNPLHHSGLVPLKAALTSSRRTSCWHRFQIIGAVTFQDGRNIKRRTAGEPPGLMNAPLTSVRDTGSRLHKPPAPTWTLKASQGTARCARWASKRANLLAHS